MIVSESEFDFRPDLPADAVYWYILGASDDPETKED